MKIDKNTTIAVLGLGKFGMSIAKELSQKGYDLFCCDRSSNLVNEASSFARNVVQADAGDPIILEHLGIGNFDIVVICFSQVFEEELLSVMISKEKGVPFIIAKGTGLRQKKILENVGADLVILPEIEMGQRVVRRLIFDDPMEYIYHSEYFEILEMIPEKDWLGKRLDILNLRETEGINILAIIRSNIPLNFIFPDTKLQKEDRLIVMLTKK